VARAAVLHSYAHPTVTAAWGLEGSFEIDRVLLSPLHVARLFAAFGRAEGTPSMVRLLQLAAVGRVAALHRVGFEGLLPVAQAPCLVDRPAIVFAVPDTLPRTYVVGAAHVVGDDRVVDALLAPAFDPRREVLLADGVALPARRGFAGTSRIVERTADRVALEATLESPGYVVLVDSFDPGWRVEVDGQAAPLRRANGAFRAVLVDGGRHRIDMRYRPRAVVAGAVVSAAAILALAVLAARARG
jgi:hypothetical protein